MTDPISNERLLPCPFCGNAERPSLGPYTGEPYFPGFIVQCDAYGFDGDPAKGCGAATGWCGSEAEAIAAWNRRQSPAGVDLKPLEWKAEDIGCTAQTCLGEWAVDHDDDEDIAGIPWSAWGPQESIGHFDTLEEAKAAAQADYERRILSCLSVEPAGVEPVAWQCFDCIMEQRSVIDDAELAAARSRRDGEWIVRPLYASPTKAETITDEMVDRAGSILASAWPGGFEDQSGETLNFTPNDRARDVVRRIAAALSSEAHNGREVE